MNRSHPMRRCVELADLLTTEKAAGFSALLENMPGAVYCCRDDEPASVKFVSARIQTLAGYPPDALMSGRINWRDLVDPKDREWTKQEVKRAVAKRVPWSLEYRIRHADGHQCWVQDRGRAVFDGDELICLQGFVSDLTAFRRSQEEVRRSEERFRATFENAAVGMAHVGLDGRWLCVNRRLCEIVGYSYDELRQRTFGDITHPEDLDADWGHAMQLLAGKIPNYSMEKRYFRKDGSVVWINLTGSLVRDSAGEPEYFIAVVEDIGARKKAERELENRTAEAEERAHQLRVLTSELVQAEDRERRRIAQVLHDHLQQLLVAAKFSLAASRGKASSEGLREEMDRVVELIEESIRESRSLTSELSPKILYTQGLVEALEWLGRWMEEKHSLAVTVNCEARPRFDDEQLSVLLFQSVRELLFNVVKHAGVREATVTLTMDGNLLRIVVEDQGSGFRPKAERDAAGGDGFGHFAIQERLKLIGGRFEIESRPGEGTRVTLEAPLRDHSVAA